MPASCSVRTIALNSCTCPPGVALDAYSEHGREEADRVVAPVVGQAAVDQERVVDEVVHRHQLHRRDAQGDEMVDDDRMCDAGVGAAHLRRDPRVLLRQPLHMGLVDDRVGVLVVGRPVDAPVEERVDHHALGHAGSGVLLVGTVRIAEAVAEQRLVPLDLAVDGLSVRIEQQLAGVASLAALGRVRPVAPGTRSAGRARRRAGTRARRTRRPRGARSGSRPGRRTGKARSARRPR